MVEVNQKSWLMNKRKYNTNFGIIQIRTDGKRVLVFTHSGKAAMKEAYRFTVDDKHSVKFAKTVVKR